MGPRLIQHDNADKVPSGAQPESAPWARERSLLDWRGLGILCLFLLLLLLIGYWLFGRDIKSWVQYGEGYAVVKGGFILLFLYAILMVVRRSILIEQRGYKVFIWNANAPRVIEQLIKVDAAYAGRMFPQAAQLTLTNSPQLAAPGDTIDGDIIEDEDEGPDIGPLRLEDWMYRLDAEPHALFAAKTKGGKSTMAKVGLKPRIDAGESIFIIDPHSNGWLDLPSVGGGLNWVEVEEAMETITQLYRDRMAERERYMRENGHELSQTYFPRVTVIFDEANESRTMIEARHKKGSAPWQPFMEIMGSGSRKVGISLWLICQSALIKNLGGSSVMRRNLTVFALDHATITELIEAEELLKIRREYIVESISGAKYPAATVLDGQAFLLDRTNLHLMEPGSARGCAWDGWDYAQRRAAAKQLPPPPKTVVSASAVSSGVVRTSVAAGAIVYPPKVRSTNGKIAWLLKQGYSYRQIERELSVSHQTISQVKKAIGI